MGKGKNSGKKKDEGFDLDAMVPVYVPSLFDLLLSAEKKKGHPLTREEVLSVRDSATVVMMHKHRAEEMMRTRSITDLNPDEVWEEWQKRKPDKG